MPFNQGRHVSPLHLLRFLPSFLDGLRSVVISFSMKQSGLIVTVCHAQLHLCTFAQLHNCTIALLRNCTFAQLYLCTWLACLAQYRDSFGPLLDQPPECCVAGARNSATSGDLCGLRIECGMACEVRALPGAAGPAPQRDRLDDEPVPDETAGIAALVRKSPDWRRT